MVHVRKYAKEFTLVSFIEAGSRRSAGAGEAWRMLEVIVDGNSRI